MREYLSLLGDATVLLEFGAGGPSLQYAVILLGVDVEGLLVAPHHRLLPQRSTHHLHHHHSSISASTLNQLQHVGQVQLLRRLLMFFHIPEI